MVLKSIVIQTVVSSSKDGIVFSKVALGYLRAVFCLPRTVSYVWVELAGCC